MLCTFNMQKRTIFQAYYSWRGDPLQMQKLIFILHQVIDRFVSYVYLMCSE